MGSISDMRPSVKVIIAGGSYAGIAAAVCLLDLGCGLSPRLAREPHAHHPELPSLHLQITIVDEREGFFHTIGAPLALADAEYARKIWTRYQDIPALQNDDITILHGSVAALDPSSKTAVVIDANTKRQHSYSYDYFIAASGLRRVWPVVPQSLTREGYLSEVENHINTLATAIHGVVVVGGGAVGIEMAAELKVVRPEVKVTLVHSGDKLLSSEGLSEECKDRTLELLKEMDVDVLLRRRVVRSSDSGKGTKEVEFTDGQRLTASQIIMAVSRSVPSTSYLPPKVLDQDGYVRILPNLSFAHTMLNAASHFCAGDAASWSGIKRCGAAMHSGHYVAYNIHQSIMASLTSHKPKFMELEEIPPMIGLAVGRKAIASGPDMGTISGEDVMKLYFNDDLGFTICWNHLQLNGRKAAELGP